MADYYGYVSDEYMVCLVGHVAHSKSSDWLYTFLWLLIGSYGGVCKFLLEMDLLLFLFVLYVLVHDELFVVECHYFFEFSLRLLFVGLGLFVLVLLSDVYLCLSFVGFLFIFLFV